MNDEGSELSPPPNWVAALEAALDELHQAVLLGAIDPVLDADAGLTRSAVGLRDLLDRVRRSPPYRRVGDEGQQRGAPRTAAADLPVVVRRAGDQVRQTVRREPDLGIDDLLLLASAAHAIRAVEQIAVRGRS